MRLSEDEQRIKNLCIYKFYGTDKELSEFPLITCSVVILVICLGILLWIG